MAEDEKDSGEKTEEATQQRREEFRKQGQVAMTRELGSALLLSGTALVLWLMGSYFAEHLQLIVKQLLGSFAGVNGKSGEFAPVLKFAATQSLFIVGPVFMISGILAFLSTTLQVGFLSNSEALNPNIDKLNPVSGFLKIASMRSLVEGLKSFLKVCLVAYVAYLIMRQEFSSAPKLVDVTAPQLAHYLLEISIKLFFGIGLLMIVLAVLDYGYNYWDLERRMMMTKQEVKEEIKSREGSPQVKARIRRIQREFATKRMMESVPKADVIITNPTHIAVALKYDANLPAPQVIAKGADLIAEKIKALAREHGIPIVENKPLARTIFKTIKIGNVIPRELFHAVAEILAYVYKLKRKAVQ